MSELRQRVEPIRSKALRRAAAGQRCTLNLPGICCYDAETVVLAHIHDEQFGKSQKADDTSGFHACWKCHAAYDLHKHGLAEEAILRLVLRAYQRTIRRLVIMEAIKIEHDAPMKHRVTPRRDKSTPDRKPPEQRAKIPAGRPLQARPFQKRPSEHHRSKEPT